MRFETLIPTLFRRGISHEEIILAARVIAFEAYLEGIGEGYRRCIHENEEAQKEAQYVHWRERVEAGLLPDQGGTLDMALGLDRSIHLTGGDNNGTTSNPR